MTAYVARYAIPLITSFEGFRSYAYFDGLAKPGLPKGTLTIGYGHTGPDVALGERLTQHAAAALLIHDLEKRGFIKAVESAMPHGSERQKAALLSAAYNLGTGILTNAHDLGRFIRSGHYAKAANSFLEYVNPGTNVEAGLRKRRKAERALFLKGSNRGTRIVARATVH